MKHSIPEFGVRVPDVTYVDRPGAYAIILAGDDKLAFVRGKAGRLFLPGGGLAPGEYPRNALMREIIEEIGWNVRILGTIGRATQFLFAEGEGYFAIRATYFRTELIEQCTTGCEHEIVWLSTAAATSLARESDAWAISQARKSK
jgi:8-oxo-dGTP diphosphatase